MKPFKQNTPVRAVDLVVWAAADPSVCCTPASSRRPHGSWSGSGRVKSMGNDISPAIYLRFSNSPLNYDHSSTHVGLRSNEATQSIWAGLSAFFGREMTTFCCCKSLAVRPRWSHPVYVHAWFPGPLSENNMWLFKQNEPNMNKKNNSSVFNLNMYLLSTYY